MCGPDDRFFSGAQRCYAILEPSACDAFSACEETALRCTCSVYGCTVYLFSVDFLKFFPGNRNHYHFSDDVGCHELQLVCHCEVDHCEVEDEDAAWRVSPWLSVIPPSGLAIDMTIKVLSTFELLILSLTLLILWMYGYQSLFCLPQVSIFHVQSLFKCIGKFLSLSKRFQGPLSIQAKNPTFGFL